MRKALMVVPGFLIFGFAVPAARLPGLDTIGLPAPAAQAQDRADSKTAIQPIIRTSPAGQPVNLEIDPPQGKPLRFVRIIGVPEGFSFSRGFSLRDGSIWYVSAPDIRALTVTSPKTFTGVARLYVDFFMLGEAPDKPGNAKGQLYLLRIGDETASISVATPNVAVKPGAAAREEVPAAAERERVAQPYQEEAVALLRAQELIKRSDVSSARLIYEDLAVSGSAQGALALARTFDPVFLRSMGAIGMQPDVALARKWYEKAAKLGNGEASKRLSDLR